MTTKTETTFRLRYEVACAIDADAETIWRLLTDAERFPEWNSTVTKIDGPIALGSKLALKVPTSERTFTPKVTVFVPNETMVWSDGFAPMFKGVRTFTLRSNKDRTTEFVMTEELSGAMLPLFKGSLPDFRETFDTYAADLKRAAERRPS